MPKALKYTFYILLLASFTLAAFFYGTRNLAPKSIWQPGTVSPYKQWYQINWQKQAVGWASVELKVTDKVFSVVEQDFIEGRVQGERLKFSFRRQLDFSKQKPYLLVGGTIQSQEPSLQIKKQFTNLEQLHLKQMRNNKLVEKSLPKVSYTLNDYFALAQFIEKQPKRYSEIVTKELNSDDFGLHYSRYKVLQTTSHELVDDELVSKGFYQVQQQLQNSEKLDDAYQSQKRILQVSPQGVTFRIKRANGMTFVASEGKVSLNPEMQRDLYLGAGISIDKPLGNISGIESLELSLDGGSWDWFRGHPALTIEDNLLKLKAGYRLVQERPRATKSSHPLAKVLAIQQTEKLLKPQQKVAALVEFVFEQIDYQTLPASFAIDEILELKIGDCTEHALLLSEMLNAIDIPARQVSGLIYLGDEKQQFGGHVWVEVFVDGAWQGVDPTWNLKQLTSTHIPLLIGVNKTPKILSKTGKVSFKLHKISYH